MSMARGRPGLALSSSLTCSGWTADELDRLESYCRTSTAQSPPSFAPSAPSSTAFSSCCRSRLCQRGSTGLPVPHALALDLQHFTLRPGTRSRPSPSAMSIVEVHSVSDWNNALRSATAAGQTVIVDAYATWCGPCKAIAPVFDQLAKQADWVKYVGLSRSCSAALTDIPRAQIRPF